MVGSRKAGVTWAILVTECGFTVPYCTVPPKLGVHHSAIPLSGGEGEADAHTPHPSAGHFASALLEKFTIANERKFTFLFKQTNERKFTLYSSKPKVCVWAVPLRRYFRTKAPQLLEEMVKIATIPRYQGNPVGWMVSSEDTRALGRGFGVGLGQVVSHMWARITLCEARTHVGTGACGMAHYRGNLQDTSTHFDLRSPRFTASLIVCMIGTVVWLPLACVVTGLLCW